MHIDTNFVLSLVCLFMLWAYAAAPCEAQPAGPQGARPGVSGKADCHSYGNPEQVQVQQFEVDLTVDFDQKRLNGIVVLDVQRQPDCPKDARLVLDTRGLTIEKAEVRRQRPFRPEPWVPGAVSTRSGRPDSGLEAHH